MYRAVFNDLGRTVFSWNFLANCSASTVLLCSLSQLAQPNTWTAGSDEVYVLAEHLYSVATTSSLTVNAAVAHVVGDDILRLSWPAEHSSHELGDDVVGLCDSILDHLVDLGCGFESVIGSNAKVSVSVTDSWVAI